MPHEANYWSAWAAWASAVAAFLSFGTALVSIYWARRSAEAAEAANLRMIRADLLIFLKEKKVDRANSFTLLIENAGPGVARHLIAWKIGTGERVNFGQFRLPSEQERRAGAVRPIADAVPLNGWAEVTLPSAAAEEDNGLYVLSWEDSGRNGEQTQFTIARYRSIGEIDINFLATATRTLEQARRAWKIRRLKNKIAAMWNKSWFGR